MRQWKILAVSAVASLSFSCGPASSSEPGGGSADGGDQQPDASPPPTTLPETAAVYAHSASELYRIDPDTLAMELVGNFQWMDSGPDQMTDIAIDRDGQMIGISFDKVYSVNKDTAECFFLANLSTSFNGLSFVPPIAPDPNAPERLIATALNGSVYEVDPMTGSTTYLGSFGGGWRSSGDIVSVRGFGTVATVNLSGADRLARIDEVTWQATIIGNTGVNKIWGLGFWGDEVHGFTDDGDFVLLDVNTGAATPVQSTGIRWWGAGVTTEALVIF
jgi:hypothetical protein